MHELSDYISVAIENEDFTIPAFSFSPPDVVSCIDITIIDDANVEGPHSFTVQILSTTPSIMVQSDNSTVTIGIIDNDGKYRPISSMIYIMQYFNIFIFLTEVAVSLDPPRFHTVLEGSDLMICASYNGTPLDRNVSIFFTVESVTAIGNSQS